MSMTDPIADFLGGDKTVIAEGMRRLALIMINGYRRDVASDKSKGWYNPIGSGAWKMESKIAELSASGKPAPGSSALDGIVTPDAALRAFWAD